MKVFTAAQAAQVCGLEGDQLQRVLDREHFTAVTVIREGDRTRRTFTREQLYLLAVFVELVSLGGSPTVAGTYVQQLLETEGVGGFDFVTFSGLHDYATLGFIRRGDWKDLEKAIGRGAIVINFKDVKQSVNAAIDDIVNESAA